MRDAMGGSVVIVIIVFFIVSVSAYLAFNVNYTKAFRMKNKIISYYEEYNGDCNNGCSGSNCCKSKIKDYAKEIGYDPAILNCSDGYNDVDGYYCVKAVEVSKKSDSDVYDDKGGTYHYYKIVTKIDIRVPILDKVFGELQVFQITGDTKIMKTEY